MTAASLTLPRPALLKPPKIRRFERFVLGEGLEKKVSDLAADVAAATGGRA